MTDREIMQQALEALEYENKGHKHRNEKPYGSTIDAMQALRAALAQSGTDWEAEAADQALTIALMKSEQEAVAWRTFDGEGGYDYRSYEDNENYREEYIKRNGEKYASWVEPLYTALKGK